MTDIVMPRLSDSMEEGIIVQWYVQSGDVVQEGQALAEIETDKATMDYESDCSGKITLLAAAGEVVALGQPIARVDEGDQAGESGQEQTPGDGKEEESILSEEALQQEQKERPSSLQGPAAQEYLDDLSAQRQVASPLAKRMARENNLSLDGVVGSGPRGRIVQKDIQQLIEGKQSSPAEARGQDLPKKERGPMREFVTVSQEADKESSARDMREEKLSRIEEIAARRMIEAKGQIPHFYLQKELDITELYHSRERIKEKIEDPPSLNDFFIRAVAKTLESHPRLRSRYEDGKAIIYPDINIAFAVATERGLIVPVLAQANRRSVSEIAAQSRQLLDDAQKQKISPADLQGAVFTISNLGMYGVDTFSAIITPGQSAVLAIGQAKERAVCLQGEVVARHIIQVTLSCDHRVVDGRAGALFLQELAWRTESVLGASL